MTELELGNLQVVAKQIGCVKIDFQQSFLHFCKGTAFRDAMKAIISQGGDTDTNACIAGMLLSYFRYKHNLFRMYDSEETNKASLRILSSLLNLL